MEEKYDYLIVGAGLFGATFANLAKEDGKKVLIIEKRNTIAGNIYTEEIDGIQVHRYGAHIFHTDYKDCLLYTSFLEKKQGKIVVMSSIAGIIPCLLYTSS